MKEKNVFKLNGFVGVILGILFFLAGIGGLYLENLVTIVLGFASFLLGGLLLSSLTIVQPNEAKVFTFFGRYVGVIREAGFWATIPLTKSMNVSLRVINFNTEKLKVNDLDGNPIDIAAVVVYKVNDAAKAVFDVEEYEEFVQIQSETTIRHIASQYPYDAHDDEEKHSLRKNSDEIAEELLKDLEHRLAVAGVEVKEARIMHLAYAPEIASAMLQRQQAQAVLSARKLIVDGAVGMVKSAITQLSEQEVVELDEEKKAQMVNNLLVALVSENGTQPVINSGTIY